MSQRIIEAVLRVSSKLGNMQAFSALGGNLAKVDRQARAFNRTQSMIAAGHRELHATVMRYAAPAVLAAYGVGAVKQFASVERQLTRTGLKLDASRQTMIGLGDDISKIADRYALARSEVTELLDAYAETGATLADVNANLGGLAKAQQGLGASGGDVAATWDAAAKSFGLATENMEQFFDVVAAGGAIGKFEGSDLARYLPSLMPVAAGQGFSGLEGTERLVGLLETMRDFVGTSQEAATATADFLEKISSPEVQKRFGEAGFNLQEELGRARDNGEDVLRVMEQIIRKATGGDASRLGEFFAERDSRRVARLLLQQFDLLEEKIETVRQRSKGMIASNVNEVLDDAQAKLDRLSNSWTKLQNAAGRGLVSVGAVGAMEGLAGSIDYASAVNSGLEKTGRAKGFVDRSIWGVMNGQDQKDSMAWVGGFRTDEQRRAVDAYGAYARSRAPAGSGPAVSPGLPKDSFGLPASGPVPAGRPGAALSLDEEFSRQMAARPYSPGSPVQFAPGATPRDAERDSMQALARQGNDVADAIADALESGGRTAASEVERSSEAMASSITAAHERGAQTIADAIRGALANGVKVNAPHQVRGDLGYSTVP